MSRPSTLAELKTTDYRPRSVKDEMRENAIRMLKSGERIFPGIIGYDDTVIPQVINAVLARHDMLFLGLRGQAKTRMLRALPTLLDESIPVIDGCEVLDDPLAPLFRSSRALVDEHGDATPIRWIHRDERYHEKLATPDVTVADLIGEIDLVKHAEGRYLADERIMHFGLIPRTNRGIFAINELPDLAPRIQVAMFNVLEERDIQIRGFPIRLPLDLCMVFTANPEDYTNRGRIVTPLKDRIGSVVRTHYPQTRQLGIEITEANAWQDREGIPVAVPDFMRAIVEEISRLARSSPHVNHSSGVSVRMSIANYENLLSNAERRAVLHGEEQAVTRLSDLAYIAASSRGKMELAMTEETGEEDQLVGRLVDEAVQNVFGEHFQPKQFHDVVSQFENGQSLEIGDAASIADTLKQIEKFGPLAKHARRIAAELEPSLNTGPTAAPLCVAAAEFLLDGLYVNNRLNKQHKSGKTAYGF